jgi:predicted ribosomally synthesized peptide with SipW-like signal peptide
MADDDAFELSRRKALAGLGTIGVASAGAGLGTSAFFSDTETFENNVLRAGSLDLKVDWQEHYSDWSDDEDDDGEGGSIDIQMSEPDTPSDYTAFPPGVVDHPDPGFQGGPLLWVLNEDVNQFMKNTATEAFPDTDNDALHDVTLDDDVEFIYDACEDGADNPNDLIPADSLRTNNDDTVDGDGNAKPIISLDDVKPGDFGELTFSFHLCDNDGYVWLQAGNVSEAENGLTEPEIDDNDEDQELDAGGNIVPKDGTPDDEGPELAEQIRTAWWYDPNGNNLVDGEQGGPVDVMVCLDTSGSLSNSEADALRAAGDQLVQDLVNVPNSDVQVGGLRFASGISLDSGLTGTAFTFGGSGSGGTTAMPAALDIADQHLDNSSRPGAEQVIILLTDGGPNYSNTTYTDGTYTAPRANNWSADAADLPYDNGGQNGVVSGELDETELVANNIKDATGTNSGDASRIITVGIGDPSLVGGQSLDDYLKNRVASPGDHFNVNDPGAVSDIIDNLVVSAVVAEKVFRQGTLSEDLAALSTGLGLPLDGNLLTDFDEFNDDPNDPNRECFTSSTDHYIGFSWWLPTDHGNEVQTDSVSFDLGFYTEQCRHNDGSGQQPENDDGATA